MATVSPLGPDCPPNRSTGVPAVSKYPALTRFHEETSGSFPSLARPARLILDDQLLPSIGLYIEYATRSTPGTRRNVSSIRAYRLTSRSIWPAIAGGSMRTTTRWDGENPSGCRSRWRRLGGSRAAAG